MGHAGIATTGFVCDASPRVAIQHKAVQLGTLEQPVWMLIRHWIRPVIGVMLLLLCSGTANGGIRAVDLGVAFIAALLCRWVLSAPGPLLDGATAPHGAAAGRVALEWTAVAALMLTLGFLLHLDHLYPRAAVGAWLIGTPLALLVFDLYLAHRVAGAMPAKGRYIIVGTTAVGVELARRSAQRIGIGKFLGYFDCRSLERLPQSTHGQLVGNYEEIVAFVKKHAVNAIYITLPMTKTPRIERLLRDLRDTAASVYFVPDIFAFDLVQARCVEMSGIPLLSICDTPLHGTKALGKRICDIVLSAAGLLLLSPLLLLIAMAVKLASPGPVLFKQRRYGLNGQQILIYKFRTMTVCEDGAVVTQARKNDQRVTRIGGFLRRTSLDELPQLLNVLSGQMSLVGPRPHAVAHNEEYRKLIDGYMIRHVVTPGITGWAQVNGLRGETATVDQMRARVEYDLEYLRDWSLGLDFRILLRTFVSVAQGRNAY